MILTEASNTRWEPDALDCPPDATNVLLRLAGPTVALDALANEILSRWPGHVLAADEADELWNDLAAFRWVHPDGLLLKIPLPPAKVVPLFQTLVGSNDARLHISAGGNVAYTSFSTETSTTALEGKLRALGLSALTLRGNGPLWWDSSQRAQIARAVKAAVDPENRFPSLDD
jgi:hypothetical protein